MTNSEQNKSALTVNKGIEQPDTINDNSVLRFKKIRRVKYTVDDYVNGILQGNITMLSRAITLIESSLPKHQEVSREIIDRCLPYAGKSQRIGITGVPGVGKSTFIEAFGKYLTSQGKKLAVLAVDPSSERSSGSILGDKTRMEQLSTDKNAFIRPSPSAGSLGGVARKSRETIILCEAAGFDTIFIETVGVGQSETTVHSMVDFFLLLMLAGAGDELQGIKRGIMEMADAIVITKADGNNELKAKTATTEYKNALHLFPPTDSKWSPKVLTCSSVTKAGIDDIKKMIEDYFRHIKNNDYFKKRRNSQSKYWMYEAINDQLKSNFFNDTNRKENIKTYEQKVLSGEISSFNAARILLDEYFSKNKE